MFPISISALQLALALSGQNPVTQSLETPNEVNFVQQSVQTILQKEISDQFSKEPPVLGKNFFFLDTSEKTKSIQNEIAFTLQEESSYVCLDNVVYLASFRGWKESLNLTPVYSHLTGNIKTCYPTPVLKTENKKVEQKPLKKEVNNSTTKK